MGLIDSIIGAESGGNPAAANPNSSAAGSGQFINSTWLDTLAKHRPDLMGSPDELLAMRNDPKLSAEMTAAYAADNQAILSKSGHPVTPGNTYLAHFAGPQGAVSVLSADPGAPVSSILAPEAIKANPFLQGMTAGDLRAWADRKMGGAQPAPAAPTGPPAAPLNMPQQTPPPVFAPPPQRPQPQQEPQQFAAAEAAPPPTAAMFAPAPGAPIFARPPPPIDLSKLRAAMASGNRGLFFGRG